MAWLMTKTFGEVGGVAVVERASGEQAGADGVEIVRADAVDDGGRLVAGLRTVAALDQVLAGVGQLKNGVNEERLAEATPGSASRRSNATAVERRDLSGVAHRWRRAAGPVPVTRWSDSQPARRLFSSSSPRTNRPAPASRTMARANWPTMRTWRKR